MKILVILQTMYSGRGVDMKAPLKFKINPLNHSGKKMLHICDGDNNDVWFSNISSICSGGGSDSFRPIDLEFVEKAIVSDDWNLIIFGGRHSVGVYKNNFNDLQNVVLMPHPAARSFTNSLKEEIKQYVNSGIFDKVREFELQKKI